MLWQYYAHNSPYFIVSERYVVYRLPSMRAICITNNYQILHGYFRVWLSLNYWFIIAEHLPGQSASSVSHAASAGAAAATTAADEWAQVGCIEPGEIYRHSCVYS